MDAKLSSTMSKKLFIVVNVDWFFLSHRLPIALEAKKRGYDVTILAIEEEGKGLEIRSHGLKFIPLPSTRGGKNVFDELKLIRFLYKTYKKEQPDIIHHVAIKPVLYGSLAAKYAGIKKIVNAVSGFGSTFINPNKFSPTYHIVKNLYRFSFNNESLNIIAQNEDDIAQLLELGPLKKSQVHLIKGSGVDLKTFQLTPETDGPTVKCILLSRMLWDKGIGEFVAAATQLKKKYGDQVEFILAGKVDPENVSCISKAELEKWNEEGNVNWIGFQTDVIGLYRNAHIAVLPSYREGLPKSLIEALAIGRPVVTTDVPGCRVVVKEGVNGFLVKLQDSKSLEIALEKLITNKELRHRMGKAGRKLAEEEFSLKMVLEKTFTIYENA